MPDYKPLAGILFGATATGKTALSLALAESLPIEIISADSRQIYREMDIGTAKPSRQERATVVHHLVDILEPHETYNAARWAQQALAVAEDIRARGAIPLIVGGAGFYLNVLRTGLFTSEFSEEDLQRTRARVQEKTTAEIIVELQQRDPERLSKIHPNDRYRLSRALEICLLSGSVTEVTRQHVPSPREFVEFHLHMDRPALHQRINDRTQFMLDQGWIEETEQLLQRYSPKLPGLATLGYPSVIEFLQDQLSREEMQERIARDTRRYARHQQVWFRKWDFATQLQVGNESNVETMRQVLTRVFQDVLDAPTKEM